MIKELRKIDPNWKATQVGFCYWNYDLIDQKGSKWHLQQCAKFCPRFDGDDDNFKKKIKK